ncbi:hypothetical protein GCM10029976_057590 [Kribbella albertanoniae]|uniref:Uncharacterized protein n=1 Tax=Kribbella albertanoniae TaxID=1266829 RepID=A0A4R4P1X5_9ACTN|nr:hypothetical protein [Kribbella albertanoniae]TDC13932.1 hypothetical protein E1261_44470 [Kribbella albertanoniae]
MIGFLIADNDAKSATPTPSPTQSASIGPPSTPAPTSAPTPAPTSAPTLVSTPPPKPPVSTVPVATPYKVPKGFLGTWRGPIDQDGSKDYSVIVTISSGIIGDSLGTVEYPELQCGGIWRLESGTTNSIRVTELIDTGSGCIDTVPITLILQDSQLRYYIDSPKVRGTLQRS